MPDAYIGLGSNLDRPRSRLRRAVAALATLPDSRLIAVSSFYPSAPMPGSSGPDYLNAVARLRTGLRPLALLRALQTIENAHGRRRIAGRRWGARTLDLDLLLYGRQRIQMPRLTVPHPGLAERAFVMEPLLEIAPDTLIIPGGGRETRDDLLLAFRKGYS